MNINIICQYFYPEIGAPQARWLETARVWVKSGHDVTVLTGFPNHPTGVIPAEYRNRLFMEERIDNIRVWRHWLYAAPNEGFFKKTCAHISFAVSLIFLSLFRGARPDVYIVSSPNFFSAISTYVFSRIRRVPYIFEIRDLWPGIFIELGILKNRFLIHMLERIELFLYRRAAMIVPVTEGFKKDLIRRGIPPEKISVIKNGVDLEQYKPGRNDTKRGSLGFARDDFVVMYLGAHGLSHGLHSVLDAAYALKGEPSIKFVFVGEGAVKADLMSMAERTGLKNVTFLPGQKKEEVAFLYQAADACLVSLKNIPGFDAFIPSKMFEIMGCGKPMIASVRGESAQIASESGAAVVVPPEDSKALAEAVQMLKNNSNQREQMGRSGRKFSEHYYDRTKLAQDYLLHITHVVERSRAI